MELARRARAVRPNEPAVADTLGWALYKQRDYPQALALIQESAENLSSNPEVLFHLGMARYMMGQGEGARAALQQAVQSTEEFPSREEAQRRLALLGAERQNVSRAALEKFVAEQPDDVLAWSQLGQLQEAENNTAKAVEAYEQARRLNPNLLAANVRLAQLYAGPLHQPEKALELAKKARELAPGDAVVAGTLGAVVLRAGNYQWAYSLLQESARQKAADPTVLHALAWASYYLGRVLDARQTMQKALGALEAAAANRPDVEQFLALTAAEEDPACLPSLEPQVQAALQRQPDYLPALVARAALQRLHGDASSAIAGYNEILRRCPEFGPAQRNLALLYSASPDTLDKAHELAVRAKVPPERRARFSHPGPDQLQAAGLSLCYSTLAGKRRKTGARPGFALLARSCRVRDGEQPGCGRASHGRRVRRT